MKTRSLHEYAGVAVFHRELHERHLLELEFLLAQREALLHAPAHPWPELEGWDRRIAAHVEAMQVGRDEALACVEAAMKSEERDARAAAVFALAAVWPERLPEAKLVDAKLLGLVSHPDLVTALELALLHEDPEMRARAAQILGYRREGSLPGLARLLDDRAPEVQAAAALALGKIGHRGALPAIERRLATRPLEEAETLLTTALLLGSTQALRRLRERCDARAPLPGFALELLALAGTAEDAPRLRRTEGLHALGVLGVGASIPWLIEALDSEWEAVAAGALALVTGAGLTEQVELAPSEEDDEEAEPRKVTRPSSDPEAWRAWWAEHRDRFDGKERFRRGRRFSLEGCVVELADPAAGYQDRVRAGLELAMRARAPIGFEADWPVWRQRDAIARWRTWVDGQKTA